MSAFFHLTLSVFWVYPCVSTDQCFILFQFSNCRIRDEISRPRFLPKAGFEARLAPVLCFPPGVDDTVTVLLQYPGGVHASFTCSITVELTNTAFVSGTKGIAQVRRHRPSWNRPKCWETRPFATGVGQLWLLQLDTC